MSFLCRNIHILFPEGTLKEINGMFLIKTHDIKFIMSAKQSSSYCVK